MTAIVGVLCRDGVVIGADRAVTFSAGAHRTIEQSARKLGAVKGKYVLAGTGGVGFNQRMEYILEHHDADIAKCTHHIEAGRVMSSLAVNNFASTRANQGSYGCLVAFAVNDKPHLCEFGIQDFQPEFKTDQIWYVSMGSGQTITDPFLGVLRRLFWKDEGLPSVKQATLYVVWTLQTVIELNVGGVNGPIDIGVLSKKDGRYSPKLLSREEIDEHQAHLKLLEGKMGEILKLGPDALAAEVPKPPVA